MESVLIVITLVSLCMTIALAVILVRLVRDERRRSDARVAVLREMAEAAVERQPTEGAQLSAISYQLSANISQSVSCQPRTSRPTFCDCLPIWTSITATTTRARERSSSSGLNLRQPGRGVWRSSGFSPCWSPQSAWPCARDRDPPRPRQRSRPAPLPEAPPSQQTALLELLSLKQTQDTGALTITGLVQNPRDGAVLSKISATALVFSADGTFLASGRAPLDYTVLRPGDESGFVISVPVNAPVARYRVGFRSEDGRVIGHIDRRTATTMASTSDAPPLRRVRGTS